MHVHVLYIGIHSVLSFVHVILYTVLLEVCPTTVLTSSKQEDSLKRALSAYGEGGGCVCERGLTASTCTYISPFACTKGKWWHSVYVCSFATAERKHVFAAPSVTQCYLILRIFESGLVLFVWLCDSSPY